MNATVSGGGTGTENFPVAYLNAVRSLARACFAFSLRWFGAIRQGGLFDVDEALDPPVGRVLWMQKTGLGAMTAHTIFDASHLVYRLGCSAPDGFTNVDFAYGRYFSESGRGTFINNNRKLPNVIEPRLARRMIRRFHRLSWNQGSETEEALFSQVRSSILGQAPLRAARYTGRGRTEVLSRSLDPQRIRFQRLKRLLGDGHFDLPEGAIYVNVVPYAVQSCHRFSWLQRRRDIRPVFFIHDLLPFDYPEFFADSWVLDFEKRIEMAMSCGRGLIYASGAVRERVEEEFARRGRATLPGVVAPLPSPLSHALGSNTADTELASVPYFIIVGTIEPRKNHMLLLSIWRHMAQEAQHSGGTVPKLVIVGKRGHRVFQVLDALDRSRALREHLIEVAGLSAGNLARLIANARGLLMPSFAEGYGLPMVEALSVGTPVVATDAPVFREVTQGCGLYHDAHDAVAWMATIKALADRNSVCAQEARARALKFRSPTWSAYFDEIDQFLKAL